MRDGRVCQCCKNTKELHAHHIKSAAFFPDLRFVVENGITICNDCHKYIHNDIAGSYASYCDEEHLAVLLGLSWHRRILRRKKEKLLKAANLKVL